MFQFQMDIFRLVLLLFIIFLIFVLLKRIEFIHSLNFDPCLICENVTGCDCSCYLR